MDVNAIGQLIGSVGFPIAACIIMFWQNDKLQKTLAELSMTLSLMNERINNIEEAVKEVK